MKSKLILLTGMLASGKSTLANFLTEQYNAVGLIKDNVKEMLCDEIGFSNRDENKQLSLMAMDMMIANMEAGLKDGANVVMDANFRTEELNKIYEISDKYDCDVVTIMLVGDSKLLYKRFLDRIPTRHRAHLSIGLDKSEDLFNEYNYALVNLAINKPLHKIEITNLSIEEVREKAISIIENDK